MEKVKAQSADKLIFYQVFLQCSHLLLRCIIKAMLLMQASKAFMYLHIQHAAESEKRK